MAANDMHEQQGCTSRYRWRVPEPREPLERRQLMVYNSFTRRKEPFVPNDRKSIKWYCCGPTVYDAAHLGHARCYITFDIIRRILAGYFNFQVFYVMNITDIDDKIIKRARASYLCDKFIESSLVGLRSGADAERRSLLASVREALDNYKRRRADEQDKDKLVMIASVVRDAEAALFELAELLGKVGPGDSQDYEARLLALLGRLREPIADEQDARLGHTVNDHRVFKNLTLKFEQEYHDDMQRLGVLAPTALTRVSEFIDEVGEYIVQLERNGFAYRSAGSIYFDTQKFDADPKHAYAKLVREAYGCQRRDLEEGEGELTSGGTGDTVGAPEKRSPNDFALWKKSKIGEPSWQTQDFEAGRPGWHIECSVMASQLLGENFDLHSGGHDLRFPHHDNEIAQAEAYYNTGKNWVNYFCHSGHLTISGCKMSKSLKNFITIRQALEEYSARQLRFAFLAHGWTETLDYSPNTMSTALSYEKTFREFFLNVSDALRSEPARQATSALKKWQDAERQLNAEFLEAVNRVDAALCDNFDTRAALNALTSLVKECNKRPGVDPMLLREVAAYVQRLLSTFGAHFDEIQLGEARESAAGPATCTRDQTASQDASGAAAAAAAVYVEALAQFRADVRRISRGADAQQSIRNILSLCDAVRDQKLPELGVRLEDRDSGDRPYVVKFVDAQTLARERALAERRDQEAKLKLETQRLERLKLQEARDEKARVPANEMFRAQADKYSQFDAAGMPTHDALGKEISKSALKKLQRLYAEQEARHSKFLESQQQAPETK